VALQNASHLQETERRATRLAALNDMGQKIAGNLELSEVFDRIVHAVAGILKTDYSRIFMIDEKEQELVLRASHGRIPIPPGRVASIKMGESVTGWASQKGESLLVPDVLKNPFWEDLPWEWVPKKEIRALICQPLHHRGQIIGYINGMSRQEGFFTEEDLSTLGVLASQAAGAIENARLFSDTRERATRLEFVGNIAKAVGSTLDPEELFRTIVDEILRVVPCERCVIGKVDQTEMPNFSYWHTGGEIGLPPISTEEKTEAIEWYIRNVYSRNQTAYLQNLGELETPWSMRQMRAGFNSLLTVPILQDGTCIAHFSLTSSRTNAFSGGQVEFLTSVAGHLGSVIRNASLYQTAEERAVRLASLNEVNLKITQNLALGEVLENVARSAVELLSGSFSRVYLLNEESGLLQIRTQFGDIGAPPKFDAHRPEKGLRGVVFQTGKPVLIQNILEDEWFEEKAWAEESGLRGFIAVPVFHEDRVIGVLNCMGKESVSFSRDDADLLQSLANLGSAAIQNARLFQESEEKGKRLATLVDVAQRLTRELDLASVLNSIAESAASLFEGDAGIRILEGGELVKAAATPGADTVMARKAVRVGKSITGQVAVSGRAIVTPDAPTDSRLLHAHREANREARTGALMCVPVGVEGRILGTLHIYRERGYQFDQNAIRLAMGLADQAAVAIQKAKFVEDLTTHAKRLEVSEGRLRSILDSAQDAIITIDREGFITLFNKGAEKMFGYETPEIVGRNINILMPSPYLENHDGYLDAYRRTGERKAIGLVRTLDARRKSGEIFPIEISIGEVAAGDEPLYTGIIRDITERHEIDRMKNEFISVVSHEIRTPLTSLRGSLGLLAGGVTGELSNQGKTLLSIAVNNTERLIRLISDILDLEKIESGSMELNIHPHKAENLAERAVEVMQGLANDHRITIDKEIEPCPLAADGDAVI